jgi:hypothetical protein
VGGSIAEGEGKRVREGNCNENQVIVSKRKRGMRGEWMEGREERKGEERKISR